MKLRKPGFPPLTMGRQWERPTPKKSGLTLLESIDTTVN